MAEETAIVKAEKPGALAIPEDVRGHLGAGTEGIGQEDVRPPRLVLAQGGHPETKRNHERYIQGVAEGDLFNDLTRTKYAQPLRFVVVKYLGKRAIEFFPEESAERKAGQNVKDPRVPLSDKRCQPTTDEKGEWTPPVADIFADYLVYLPDTAEVVALSFKNADLGKKGAATQLNSLIKYPIRLEAGGPVLATPPAWVRTFELGSASKSKGQYNWAVFTLKLVDGPTLEDVRRVAASVYDQFKAANVVIEDEPETTEPDIPGNAGLKGNDEDVPF